MAMHNFDLMHTPPHREEVPLDTPLFRAYRGVYPAPRIVPPHYHDEIEILIFEGLAGETWVSGKRHPFQRKSAQVIGHGKVHGFKIRPQGDGSVLVVQINTALCASFLNGYPGFDHNTFQKELDRLPVNMQGLNSDLLETTLRLSPFGNKTPASLKTAFSDLEAVGKLLRLLLDGCDRHAPAPPGDERLRRILDAVEKDINMPFSLERLSKKVSISKHHLCRHFKKSTGMNLSAYSAHVRVQQAAGLLAEKGRSVTDAAFETGFESVSYFIKVFKKIMGKSPKQWSLSRNLIRKKTVKT